jgi:hypothetical protein
MLALKVKKDRQEILALKEIPVLKEQLDLLDLKEPRETPVTQEHRVLKVLLEASTIPLVLLLLTETPDRG